MDHTQAIGIASFFTQSDAIGKTIFAVLLVMSVATWYLIITKTLQTRLTRRRSRAPPPPASADRSGGARACCST